MLYAVKIFTHEAVLVLVSQFEGRLLQVVG